MRAGRKDRRIEIQQLATAKSSLGSNTETWTLYKEVWAMVMPAAGREGYTGDGIYSQVDTIFRIDYIAGISPKTHRIKYQGIIYNIYSVSEIEGRKQTWEITAKAQGI